MLNEFDAKAGNWDNNPVHIERSQAIAKVLQKMVSPEPGMKGLEFGAGTGLLSFLLKDLFSEITLMDSSPEMIRIIREKIAQAGITHMKPVLMNLEKDSHPERFDMIFNQMVLHHVDNIPALLQKFHNMLNPGGRLVVADLYPEDGSFHGEGFSGYKGFEPDWLAGCLAGAGFLDVRHQWCYTIRKPKDSGAFSEFPVFLITAAKTF